MENTKPVMEKLSGWIILSPAYGRDYKSSKALLEDFKSGKDFIYHSHKGTTYTSITDIAKGAKIEFRYAKLTKLHVHTMK